jgi:hypothetical protein
MMARSDPVREELKSLKERLKGRIEWDDGRRALAQSEPYGYPFEEAYEIRLAVWHKHLDRLEAIAVAYSKNITTAKEASEFIAKINNELDDIEKGIIPESLSKEIAERDDEIVKWYQQYHPGYDPKKRKDKEASQAKVIEQDDKSKALPRHGNKTNTSKLHGLRVFLCHSSGDKPSVRDLYKRLVAAGADPWLDETKLLPGQDWDEEISKAIRTSHIVLVCLSHDSINEAGYVQKEIKRALDIADQQPEGKIFLIPVKFEECDIPRRLQQRHWVNLFEKPGWKKLLDALEYCANSLGTNPNPGV